MLFCKAPVTSFNTFPAISLSQLFFKPSVFAFLSGGETTFVYYKKKQEVDRNAAHFNLCILKEILN
jgi:hypothetical protein